VPMSALAAVATEPTPPVVTTVPPKTHLAFLDGVRGLAALFVVLHHAMANLPGAANGNGIERVLSLATREGHFAVDIFIVLSGYCLMLPLARKGRPLDIALFLQRRAVRILPTYFLAMLMSLLLIATLIGQQTGTHWDVSVPVTGRDIWLHLLLVHDWFVGSAVKINHPFWSIGVEWKIYFLFPLLLALARRWGALATAVAATLLGYVVWAVLMRWHIFNPTPWGSSPYYVGLFAMGMWAADVGEHPMRHPYFSRERLRTALALLSAALLILIVQEVRTDEHFLRLQLASAVSGAWAAAFLLALRMGAAPGWIARLMSWRGSVWIGAMGYSVYLVHAPIVQLVYLYVVRPSHLPGPWRGPLMLVASTGATLLVATAFYRIAERPFHALSRRLAA
jgi:peptidoglycan/LPS O-acetylase OafA/YrhL